MTNLKVNSKDYWDMRFRTDWEIQQGREQTTFFCNIILTYLPEWLTVDIKYNHLSICDAGCADGDAVHMLSKFFPHSKVEGVDFSKEAIERAKKYYPDHSFYCSSIEDITKEYDVILSSNTLEHFQQPFAVLKHLLKKAKKHVILLLPFQEYNRIEEHFFTFDYDSFPLKIDEFALTHYTEIDAASMPNTLWGGKQILVVYSNCRNVNLEQIYLETFARTSSLLEDERNQEKSKSQNLMLQLEEKENDIHTLRKRMEEQDRDIHDLHSKINRISDECGELKKTLAEKEEALYAANKRFNDITSSRFWRASSFIYRMLEKSKIIYVYKTFKMIKRQGVKEVARKVSNKVENRMIESVSQRNYETELKEILEKHKGKPIVIFPPLVDWNIPLFQRPQHIAINLANEGFLYFYCTTNTYDKVHGFQKVEGAESLYLTNQYELLVNSKMQKVFHFYAQDHNVKIEHIERILANNDVVLYEYIDAIHADLNTGDRNVLKRHEHVMKNERCMIVSTAEKLHREVISHRKDNCMLVTNGVEYEHFNRKYELADAPEEMLDIIQKGKPIIGYFGAFATWFDYALVEKVAKERPDYEIVLLGWNYDGSIKKSSLYKYDNVTILGPIDYKKLPSYACWFDVSTIPFLINEITESTSPVKLFEYMALGHPIVTTDMPECRKYKSVLIGKSHDEFISKIDEALKLRNDHEYKEILEKEGIENTWRAKAQQIACLIHRNF
jgi:teichuronic acid biosynthesis glycosyltransferase TuaH